MSFIFRIVSAIHSALYRWTSGRLGGHFNNGDILLLTTTGRKSGKTRSMPVMYVENGESYLVTASAGGSPRNPGWYWNATRGNHPVQIQVMDKVMAVDVEEAPADKRDDLYQRFIDMNAQFGGYEEKAGRPIPVLILTPQ